MRYPLFLDLAEQPAVVIGAGSVATRKIRSLLAAGARVTIISPEATPALKRLVEAASPPRLGIKRYRGGDAVPTVLIRWLRRRYRRGDLRGARLVIAATDDLEVNQAVCVEAKRRGLLVNCVAPPAAGNFIVPSLVRRGGVTLAISTGGTSPAFAKRLRRDLERFLGDEYPALLKKMAKQRRARKHA